MKGKKTYVSVVFELLYYLSSLIPQYIILLILFTFQNENHKKLIKYLFYNHLMNTMLIILVVCFFSLWRVDKILDNVQSKVNTSDLFDVHLSYDVNPGFGNFFLNALIPIISLFPSFNSQLTSFVMIWMAQICVFVFYALSSDTFPNLSLLLFTDYNIYKVDRLKNIPMKFNKLPGNMEYIIGKCDSNKNRRDYCGQEYEVIPLEPSNKNSKFAVIRERH